MATPQMATPQRQTASFVPKDTSPRIAQPFLSAVLTPDGFLRKDIDLLQLLDSSVRPTQYAVAKTVFTLEVLQNGELHKHAADEETKKLGAALKALGEKLTGPITAADLSTPQDQDWTRDSADVMNLVRLIDNDGRSSVLQIALEDGTIDQALCTPPSPSERKSSGDKPTTSLGSDGACMLQTPPASPGSPDTTSIGVAPRLVSTPSAVSFEDIEHLEQPASAYEDPVSNGRKRKSRDDLESQQHQQKARKRDEASEASLQLHARNGSAMGGFEQPQTGHLLSSDQHLKAFLAALMYERGQQANENGSTATADPFNAHLVELGEVTSLLKNAVVVGISPKSLIRQPVSAAPVSSTISQWCKPILGKVAETLAVSLVKAAIPKLWKPAAE